MNKTAFRRASRRWHKRAGIASAIIVLLLSITGIFLNHTSELGLGGKSIQNRVLLSLYGQAPPSVKSQKITLKDTAYYLSDAEKEVFLDTRRLSTCEGALVGALDFQAFWVLACEFKLSLFTHNLELIESIDSSFGLPTPISGVQVCGEGVCAQSQARGYRIDLNSMAVDTYSAAILAPKWVDTPAHIRDEIHAQYSGSTLTWERVILDIHAGRFLGTFGPWFMDIAALCFIFLALSGIYIWWFSEQRRKPHRKRR